LAELEGEIKIPGTSLLCNVCFYHHYGSGFTLKKIIKKQKVSKKLSVEKQRCDLFSDWGLGVPGLRLSPGLSLCTQVVCLPHSDVSRLSSAIFGLQSTCRTDWAQASPVLFLSLDFITSLEPENHLPTQHTKTKTKTLTDILGKLKVIQ
jgi:hypothetical protein